MLSSACPAAPMTWCSPMWLGFREADPPFSSVPLDSRREWVNLLIWARKKGPEVIFCWWAYRTACSWPSHGKVWPKKTATGESQQTRFLKKSPLGNKRKTLPMFTNSLSIAELSAHYHAFTLCTAGCLCLWSPAPIQSWQHGSSVCNGCGYVRCPGILLHGCE